MVPHLAVFWPTGAPLKAPFFLADALSRKTGLVHGKKAKTERSVKMPSYSCTLLVMGS